MSVFCGGTASAGDPPVPSNGSRVVVVLGSSTAEGVGASLYSRSWVSQLAGALAPLGLEVVNSSISGTSTGNSLLRFTADVVPRRPDFVVLATSLWNEGFATNPVPSVNNYLKNTRTLIAMTEAIGAIPVLLGPYPNDASTPQHVALVKSIYAELEAIGLPLWDMWNGLADENGRWIPGLSMDGTHPLDIGHRYMFDAIPITQFPAAYGAAPARTAGRTVRGFWTSPDGTGEIAATMAPMSSWSLGARFFSVGPVASGPAIAAGGDAGVKVVYVSHAFQIYIGDQFYSSVAFMPSARPWVDVLLSYRSASGQLALYVDGNALTTSTPWPLPAVSQALWRSGCSGCTLSDLVLYRVGFGADEAAALHARDVPKKSVEFCTPLTAPAGPVNGARNAINAWMGGDWIFSWYLSPRQAGTPTRRVSDAAIPR